MCSRIGYITLVILLLNNPISAYSQDSTVIARNKSEEQMIAFQEYFFKALAQKSVENYRLAIQNLEQCNLLKPNDVAVLFEFSKNYFYLNKPLEAVSYAKKALAIDPFNRWILKHLVAIYTSENDFVSAISIQEKLAEANPKNNVQLVALYFKNNDREKAEALLLQVEKNQGLTPGLKILKQQFLKPTTAKVIRQGNSISELTRLFKTDKSFETLRKIVSLSAENNHDLFSKYSGIGIQLYPTQAVFYLEHARALQYEKKFELAVKTLKDGIDFVVDNPVLEADFYDELANCYTGLSNGKEARKNKAKAQELRKKQ